MKFNKTLAVSLSACLLAFGCSKDDKSDKESKLMAAGLRPLSQAERAADYDQLISQFKSYYGPYAYKEDRLKINIEQEGARLKNLAVNAASDEEFAGYVMQFGAMLKDGHVSMRIKNSPSGIAGYSLPIITELIEGRLIIDTIDEQLSKESGLSKGDEIVEVDGKAPLEYLPIIKKYTGLATELSENLNIFKIFSRASYMTDLIPKSPNVNIKVKKADSDDIQAMDLPWTLKKYNADLDKMVKPVTNRLNLRVAVADELNSMINNVTMMGADNPFFITPQTQKKYNFIKLYPSADSMKKVGLKDTDKPPIYAALYRYNNKNILLVRIASYSPSDFSNAVYMKTYQALLTEFQPMADILVLDQTHNPGGSYCSEFYQLFAKPGDSEAVQRCNADRKWINGLAVEWPALSQTAGLVWDAKNSQAMSLVVEKAYDAGQRLSEPIPIFTGQTTVDNDSIAWEKPMIVLVDELAGSCGDIFPMLVKANKRAKLFGQQTMGLGGNVEPVDPLSNSRISINVTRGLYTTFKKDGSYRDADFVENNGVSPDIEYKHSVKDVRGGFVDYVKKFSEAAVAELQPATPPPAEVKPGN